MGRGLISAFAFLILFLIACSSQGAEERMRSTDAARLFLAMEPDASYAEVSFSGSDATALLDLAKAECPTVEGSEFTRATLTAPSATLILYTTDGETTTCSVLRPASAKEWTTVPADQAPSADVMLTVNGQPVTRADLQAMLAQVPQGTSQETAAQQAIAGAVDAALLRHEAQGIVPTAEDTARARATILAQMGVTEEALPDALTQAGITAEAFEADVIAQAQLERLLRDRLLIDEVNVTKEAAQEFYLTNPNRFLQTETAVMRQILISGEGRTVEEGTERAMMIAERIPTSDFCKLVQEFSDDDQGKANCGMYLVPRGVLPAQLEQAAFGTPANRTAVVTTETGIHLVQTISVNPAQVLPYAQVEEAVRSGLANSVFQQRLAMYLTLLRADADVTVFSDTA